MSGLAIIVLLIAALIAYVLVVINPNDYKPQIAKAASEQGIDLKILGNLSLQGHRQLAAFFEM